MYNFTELDAKREKDNIIKWIQDYFNENGNPNTLAVIGISGGVDSSVAAALCVKALGRDRVLGINLPDTVQDDIDEAKAVVDFLGIQSETLNIGTMMGSFYNTFQKTFKNSISDVVIFNTPARVRMTMLYAVAGQVGGRVVNTCNLSESFVGYDTKWGDNAGDFAPISQFTKTEVRRIGAALGLKPEMINKVPIDGLCGLSDEERYGFTYEQLDNFIRDGEVFIAQGTADMKILQMNKAAQHKLNPIPFYPYRAM